jgi:hypothetical protein
MIGSTELQQLEELQQLRAPELACTAACPYFCFTICLTSVEFIYLYLPEIIAKSK